VPQKDIVHLVLTVHEAFIFAARLRLDADMGESEMEERISNLIDNLGLREKRNTIIGNLSGGQLKRVSLGVELLADPSLIYLDEATSGLDSGTEAQMMQLFRDLANKGKTVICITHNIDNVACCDLVAVLCKGMLAYYGPPADLPRYFGADKISEIYGKLENKNSKAIAHKFADSKLYSQYIGARLGTVNASESAPPQCGMKNSIKEFILLNFRQLKILCMRSVVIMRRDQKSLLLALMFPILIGVLIGLVFGLQDLKNVKTEAMVHKMGPFIMAIAVIFFGCVNASKEIVKELSVYQRERAINLAIPAYIASKVLIQMSITFCQCLILLTIVYFSIGLQINYFMALLALLFTSLGGIGMGLCISAMVDNNDKAISLAIIAVIPQIILAGAIIELPKIIKPIAGSFIILFWENLAMQQALSKSIRDTLNIAKGNYCLNIFIIFMFFLAFVILSGVILRSKDVTK
jgi:energy-coupling factor transporter ATP-binding protein EcfA2